MRATMLPVLRPPALAACSRGRLEVVVDCDVASGNSCIAVVVGRARRVVVVVRAGAEVVVVVGLRTVVRGEERGEAAGSVVVVERSTEVVDVVVELVVEVTSGVVDVVVVLGGSVTWAGAGWARTNSATSTTQTATQPRLRTPTGGMVGHRSALVAGARP